MANYGIFLAGALAMAFIGGLAVFLVVRPWIRPIRRSLEASHQVIIEKSRLEAAKIQEETAKTQEKANEAAIKAEESKKNLINKRKENDQLEEACRRAASRRENADEQVDEIENAMRVEEARARLRWVRLQNDQQMPPPWEIKRQYIKWTLVLITLFLLATMASIYFSK